jgi:DNA-binding transcriptional LysR family regulator
MPGGLLDVELRHLVTFQVLARRLSFRATAAELGFAQSAISQHIVTLENRVGARLVERSRGARTVRLTPAGEQLLGHVDAILARVKTAGNELAQRPLRVGVFQSVGSTVVPDALAASDLTPELVESEGDLGPLRTGTLDLTFTETRPRDGDIGFAELFEDPYMLLVPAADPRPANTRISFDALLSIPILPFRSDRSTCHFGMVARALAAKGIRFREVLASDDAPTLHGLVAAGVGAAIIPRLAVNAADERVRALPLDPRFPPRRICLAWEVARPASERLDTLIEAFRRASSSRMAGGA